MKILLAGYVDPMIENAEIEISFSRF